MTDRLEFAPPLPRLALLRRSQNPHVVAGLWFCPDHTPADTLCVRIGRSRIPCSCRLVEQKPDGVCVLSFHATLRTRKGLKWIRFRRESTRRPSRTIIRCLLNMRPRLADQAPLLPLDYGATQAKLLDSFPVPHSGPLISVLMPVFNPPLDFLAKAVASVRAQTYKKWELCIADDASTDPRVRELLEREAYRDPRIKLVRRPLNGHISAASNSALALASGEWCALLDQDDELHPQAFTAFVQKLKKYPDAALAYSDEDKICADEKRFGAYHKPAWMPELLFGQNFVSHLGIYRTDRLRVIAGFREGYEGCQDWDLVLRYTLDLPASRILHLPFVLYHWRVLPGSTAHSVMEKPYVIDAALRTVRAALEARAIEARLPPLCPGQFRVELVPAGTPAVTVLGLDNPADRARLSSLSAGVTLRFAPQSSGRSSVLDSLLESARAADTDTVLLISPDLLPRHADWLRRLVAAAAQPGVAASGGGLIDKAGRLVSGSLGLDAANNETPLFKDRSESDPGYHGRAHLMHNPDGLDLRGIVLRRDALLGLSLVPSPSSNDPVAEGWRLGAALRATGKRLIHDPGVQFDLVSSDAPVNTDSPDLAPASTHEPPLPHELFQKRSPSAR
jgi:GT2 family glycosyltransferase